MSENEVMELLALEGPRWDEYGSRYARFAPRYARITLPRYHQGMQGSTPDCQAPLGGQAVRPPAVTGAHVGLRGKVPRHILLVAMSILSPCPTQESGGSQVEKQVLAFEALRIIILCASKRSGILPTIFSSIVGP